MRQAPLIALMLIASAAVAAVNDSNGPRSKLEITYRADAAGPLVLNGSDSRQQLIVTGDASRDFTHEVRYEVTPTNVVQVDSDGVVSAIANGAAIVTAQSKNGLGATIAVRVENFGQDSAINFPNQIVPIFTKLGCNGGGCHGKSGGQNGFRLSLLGFEPTEDYEHLVKEARGRRIFPAAPDRSLLLQKSTGIMPHGGGKRLEIDSDDYRLLVRWISQGMPYGKPDDPTVARIEVYPDHRILSPGAQQQLAVTAVYTNGSCQDVTRQALFEANAQEIAAVDSVGHVKMFNQPGDVAVMVRYQGKVAVFRATEPLGAPIATMPPVRSFIDELAFKKLAGMGMPPSPVCRDETFIRRATIDIAGRLPTPRETREFLADESSGKRQALIDRLLDSTDYAEYFANKWSALLRNRRGRPTDAQPTFAFHDWIRDSLVTNKPYDQFVRQILTATGDVESNPPVAWYRQGQDANIQLQDTAQLFMGMRLLCAQCHHHPFEKWSQKDYYQFSAFFSRVGRQRAGPQNHLLVFFRPGAASAVNPKTRKTVGPAGLGQNELRVAPDRDPREALADWLTSENNPYFARALVNRYWKHFFGRGIVEPEDDMRETNPPTNPALLDRLADHFVKSGFDLKDLIRTICDSSLYQLDSTPNQYNAIDRQNFARFYPKRITAETLLDAVNSLTGSQSHFEGLPAGTPAMTLADSSYNVSSYFLMVFGRPDALSACECERSQQASLAQSLHLLNAKELQEKLAASAGRASTLAASDGTSDQRNIEELYVLAFSRAPNAAEMSTAQKYIEKMVSRHSGKDVPAMRRAAYEDLIWALMNTKEFSFNH